MKAEIHVKGSAASKVWLKRQTFQTLSREILQIREGLFHMGPVRFRYKNDVYSSSNIWGNNLAQPNGKDKLTKAANSAIEQIDESLAEFVTSLILLKRAGGQFRIEEANGGILDIPSVATFFGQLETTYGLTTGSTNINDVDLKTIKRLQERSKALAIMTKKMAKRIYRFIDGKTLRKTTHILPAGLSQNPEKLNRQTGVCSICEQIEHLAQRACTALKADFVLIRGPRRPYLPQDLNSVKKHDFFCCVVVSKTFSPEYHQLNDSIAEMQWAQSNRMSFNCWKFWYGNLAKEERLPDQYYWIPSTIPDIATNESSFHKGHAKAAIANTIRWPFELAISNLCQSRKFKSIADVRWCRGPNNPQFEEADLILCSEFIGEAKFILQNWADNAAHKPVIIDKYNRDYYGGN